MVIRSYRKSAVFAAVIVATSCAYAAHAYDPAVADPSMHDQIGADRTSNAGPESAYLAENDVAMAKMMDDMAVKPSGDVDRDFVGMMTPHHQGAIEMAVAELKYGKNEQLKRIAQEIIVDQQQEIAAMKLAVGDPLPASNAAPTQVAPDDSPAASMHGMDPDMKM
jgi:hypothetical protein